MADTPLIQYEVSNMVALLRLNHPQTLNALTGAMIDQLHTALDRAEASARSMVLAANGRAFCSGANLFGGMGDAPAEGIKPDAGAPLESALNPLMTRLRSLTIPWISAVQGAAAGGGASLALAGDLIVAAEDARFVIAFARIGLVPDCGAFHMMVRTLGRVRANEVMLLGGQIDARRALELGLVNRVVPNERLTDEALALAKQLAEGPRSLATIRRLSWQALDADFAGMLREEREAQRDCGHTQDFEEGVAAFLEKRPARFRDC